MNSEEYSTDDSSKRIRNIPAVLNFDRLFLSGGLLAVHWKELQVLPLVNERASPSQPHELFFVLHARLLMLQPFLGERQEGERLQIDGLQLNANTCLSA
jgi:hypothetical protein